MGAYIVRRVIAMVLMLFVMSMIVFLLFSALPADPARLTCGQRCTPLVVEANRKRLGYDKPLYEQYAVFVKGIFAGRTFGAGTQTFECEAPCLGYSFDRQENVTDLITERFPVTMQLVLGAFVIWIVSGVAVGIIAALKRGRWPDRLFMGLALIGYSFPTFFIGLLLVFFIQIKYSIIGFGGYQSIFDSPTGWFTGLILPWITLALVYAAFYSRLTRNQMLETLGEDYIRTARAKGLSERRVIGKHAFRAGLTPIVTAAGLDLSILLGGVVITEFVFNLRGLGSLSVDSVIQADLPVITATVLVAATFVIIANLVVDILYAVIDPRVRLA